MPSIVEMIALLVVFVPMTSGYGWDEVQAEIGNYSQFIADYNVCGIGKKSLLPEKKCLIYSQGLTPISDSRDAGNGDVPWVVYVDLRKYYKWHENIFGSAKDYSYSKCSGGMITPFWILTAAHCHSGDLYRVYNSLTRMGGDSYEVEKFIQHPEFIGGDQTMDIALLKLKEPIKRVDAGNYYLANGLCLPEPDSSVRDTELAYVSGWGKRASSSNTRLEIGFVQISHHRAKTFKVKQVKSSLLICEGDSGSPIWQYVLGRAVIVGVQYATDQTTDVCVREAYATYVPQFVDWIIDTINNN